jgi:hypothetical protein
MENDGANPADLSDYTWQTASSRSFTPLSSMKSEGISTYILHSPFSILHSGVKAEQQLQII